MNRPGEIWLETLGGSLECLAAPTLDDVMLSGLGRQIASFSNQGISREHPLLSASLPDGSRVQIVAPPATRGPMALAIRKNVSPNLTLGDYVKTGAFVLTQRGCIGKRSDLDIQLEQLLEARDFATLLRTAVCGRKNVLISGGTSTGKTTFLNALIQEIPAEERLIFIEDTPELRLVHANALGLIATRNALGEARVSTDDLLAASLRMWPDRIIVGELRGSEAYAFLRTVNTGHPGSMTTVHADSPERAIEQIALLVLQTGTNLSREDVHYYVRSSIDVFVQINRVSGERRITEIMLGPMSGASQKLSVDVFQSQDPWT